MNGVWSNLWRRDPVIHKSHLLQSLSGRDRERTSERCDMNIELLQGCVCACVCAVHLVSNLLQANVQKSITKKTATKTHTSHNYMGRVHPGALN